MYQVYENLIQGLLRKGFGSVDNWFKPEELDCLRKSLLCHYQCDDFHLAGVGKQENFQHVRQVRNDQVFWLNKADANEWEKIFFLQMGGFVEYLNQTCFTAIRAFEFHYALYEEGSFYKRHVDRFKNDDSRQFSFVCYLTENWDKEDGGELVLYFDDKQVKIEPRPGRVIFFPSDLEHEVLRAGARRLSLTGWLKN